MKKLGALWLHKDKNDKHYLSGKFGDTNIVVFKNGFKKDGSKDPDWIIYESKPRDEEGL